MSQVWYCQRQRCHEMAQLANFVVATIKKRPESQLSIVIVYSHVNSSSNRANEANT